MKTDIIDNGDSYEVNAELAGFDKNDIHMDYRENTLSISAKKDTNHDNENGKVFFLVKYHLTILNVHFTYQTLISNKLKLLMKMAF